MTITEFSVSHLDAAVNLFQSAYLAERDHNPDLPAVPFGNRERLRTEIADLAETGGVAALEGTQLIGYMFGGYAFSFKGQHTSMVPEVGHAIAPSSDSRPGIYVQMLTRIGKIWTARRSSLHILGYLAHDTALETELYRFGYGQILAERIRDLSSAPEVPDLGIEPLADLKALLELETEHRRYYRGSPIFVNKPHADRDAILNDLREEKARGSIFLVHIREGEPVGYFIVGPTSEDGEGLLLRGTNSAQIRGAFVKPSWRGRGIGRALLGAAIRWSQVEGFDRLFVEHESANVLGRAFWGRHFTPFVRFTMRYVELPDEATG